MKTHNDAHHKTPLIGPVGWVALLCIVLLFAALAASINTKPYMPPAVAQKYMEHWLIESSRHVAGEVRLKHTRAIEPFYLRRDYQPVWMNSFELTPAAKELLQVLRETAADDWRHYGYELPILERETNRLSNIPKQATAVEVLLTDAFVTFAKQALNAELLPDTNEADHPSIRRVNIGSTAQYVTDEHVVDILNDAVRRDQLDHLISQLKPTHPGYLRLRNELNRYRAIADSGLWRELPRDMTLQPQQRHAHIPQLRWMLAQYGDLQESRVLSWLFTPQQPSWTPEQDIDEAQIDLNQADYLYDNALVLAIKRFQQRHNLTATGEIDDVTLRLLNVTPYQMTQRIALNMKRWRHLPRELGQRHVMVNMADYRLQLISGNTIELDMKVIIGNEQRRTPVMVDSISTLELAPTWAVPRRIAVNSILPRVRRNPDYLEQNNYQLVANENGVERYVSSRDVDWSKMNARNFPYRIIQSAGPHNALGGIKFIMPNDQDIYLHDTSQPQLFSLDKRAISSGCVRVEQPNLLAEKLLRGHQGWHRPHIDRAIEQGRTTRIRLQEDIPVYLMYWTTWVDDNGTLQIREDIYKRDLTAGMKPHNPSLAL
ncbi:MAG: L,D-transpeptidase family protein [Bacterioplanes sp.]|nr:L,D-transpeptidase family protein [Bacterioplanes sp.]